MITKRVILKAFILFCTAPCAFLPFVVSADYVAVENSFDGSETSDTSKWALIGLNEGMKLDVLIYGTSSYSLVDSLEFAICNNGTSAGRLDLEVRHMSTSSAIVASSSLSMSAFPTISCGVGGVIHGATSTAFALNAYISQTEILPMYVTIYARGGLSASAYFSWRNVTLQGSYVTAYRDNVLQAPLSLGYTYSPWARFISQGISGGEGIRVDYTASTSAIVCTNLEGLWNIVGCAFSSALAFVFYPDENSLSAFNTQYNRLASTSPFGYAFDIVDTITLHSSDTATSALLVVNIGGVFGSTTGSTTQYLTLISATSFENILGTQMWDLIMMLFSYSLWFAWLWWVWGKVMEII